MVEHITVEPLGDHEYLLRLSEYGRSSETRFRADPSVLDALGVEPESEREVVERTADFLIEHQDAWDLPPWVDLDDVVACYQNFPAELQRRLHAA
jgi:hypothetical protein